MTFNKRKFDFVFYFSLNFLILLFFVAMQLVINTRGAYLQKAGNCFKLKTDEQTIEIAQHKVSSILLTTSVALSTDAVKLAIDNNIDIIFLDEYGNPFARIWHCKLGSTALIRRRQLEVSESEEGLLIALEWVKAKFDCQIELLRKLRQTRPHRFTEITEYIQKLEDISNQLHNISGSVSEQRNNLLGVEGTFARIYFDAISNLMPEKFQFQGRSRNPARDPFNALLNYAYGILYSMVEKACIVAGLEPFLGFLHSDNYNKKSLVFDIIEKYRPWADEVVISLIAGRKVRQDMFDTVPNGLTLNKEGKNLLISSFFAFMEETIRYRNRNIQRKNIIQYDCHQFANKLIGKTYEEQ